MRENSIISSEFVKIFQLKKSRDSIRKTVFTKSKLIFSNLRNETKLILTFDWNASREWVTSETFGTATNWIMIDYFANGI